MQLLLLLFLLWTAPAPVVELPTPSVTDGEPKNKPISEAFFWGAVNEFTIRSNTPVQESPLQTLPPQDVDSTSFPPQDVDPWDIPYGDAQSENVQPPITRNRLGLHVRSDLQDAADLELLRNAGFTLMILDNLQILRSAGIENEFFLYYNIGIPYLLPTTISRNGVTIMEALQQEIAAVPNDLQENISAFGLFYLPSESSEFHNFSEVVNDTLRTLTNHPLYYHTYDAGRYPQTGIFDFVIEEFYAESESKRFPQSPVVYFHPAENLHTSIVRLDELLRYSLQFEHPAIILPYEWIVDTLREYPGISVMLREYAHGNRFALPLPSTPEQERGANGHFILFWILAGFLVILIRYYPMIPQFALRYYFNHTFFMQDIMEGRVRNPKGAFYFLALQTLFSGLFVYTFLQSLFNEPGFSVIAWFAKPIMWSADPALSLAIFSVILSIFVHFISVSWLYLLISDINQIYKAVNLYAWGLFVHILLTTLLIALSAFPIQLSIVFIIGMLYYVVWVSAFLAASLHGTKKLESKRGRVLFSTFGLYLFLAAALLLLFVQSDRVAEISKLAYLVSW